MIITKPKNFDLDQIFASGQCFRWEPRPAGGYYMPIGHGNNKISLKECKEGFLSGEPIEYRDEMFNYFDLGTNYHDIEIEVYRTRDQYLIKCYEHGKGIRILRQDLWETLITFIISQNNNIPRIKKSVKAICSGSHFPTPEELMKMDLTDKGLGYRDKYIKDACKHFMNPRYVELLHSNDHEVSRDALKDIHGVGDKVADCVRLFGLHHLEALPIDTHIKQVIDREYSGKMPEWVHGKYAGVFQQYIFYYETNYRKGDRYEIKRD